MARRRNLRSPAIPDFANGENWHNWTELTVRLTGVPPQASTLDVFNLLSSNGYIHQISLEEDRTGSRTGEANVIFCPPPAQAFWIGWVPEDGRWAGVNLEPRPKKRTFHHRSPIDSKRYYPEHQIIVAESIDFGFTLAPQEMMTMRTVGDCDSALLLNLLKRELLIHFSLNINHAQESYKVQIPLLQIHQVIEMQLSQDKLSLIIPLDEPPLYFRKLHNTDITHDGGRRWSERKTWYRQTDIVEDPRRHQSRPLELRKREPIIDIGRWKTLRFVVDLQKHGRTWHGMRMALKDYNVIFHLPNRFTTREKKLASFWERADKQAVHGSGNSVLSWLIRYQLDVCISQDVLLEENISADFIDALSRLPEREAVLRLEWAAGKRQRIFDPMSILSVFVPFRTLGSQKIPQHCILSRSATITPSTIYLSTPAVEMSNRILREYPEHADRFLRIRFTDEKNEGRINSIDDDSQNAVFSRIFTCLKSGIIIGGRHYEFLAMGNSQFRERGAYLFASEPGVITAAEIRAKMGDFRHIKVPAKWASRMGQCFSTTRAIRGTNVKIVEIADISRAGYTFTDGVGKISRQVADIIAGEMHIRGRSGEPPSVFQIRLGGIKGVLAISSDTEGHEVHIRPSQYKFPALYEGLEVIRYSSFTSVVLNRQLITVLNALGVSDMVFIHKMRQELEELEQAMTNEQVALHKLQHRIDFNQMTLTLAEMVLQGFLTAKEPFLLSCLRLWRVWYHKSLKEKAGLTIGEGAFVLGCVDETGLLRGYDSQTQTRLSGLKGRAAKIATLPQIFIQVDPLKTGTYKVVKGVCIVARNPSLHPGDIRVVEAVDIPALHHLQDVVVFSQNGDRDVPSMCSGGDLDGDDFVVIWDPLLIPPESGWNEPAMDFTGPSPKIVSKDITVADVIPFFVTYMKTDKLRSIATSHLANADYLDGGIRHPRCLELAALHSIAVDYPKSGVPAPMSQNLRPFLYPHFMQSRWRAADRIYHSRSVLGQLFDMVTPLDFEPPIHLPFDQRILGAYSDLDDNILTRAKEVKQDYDNAMRRIMAQHDIATEFEVWTTFVLEHARITNEYSFHEEIGRLTSALQERFREICYDVVKEIVKGVDGVAEFSKNGPEFLRFVAAMYRVTADEINDWQERQVGAAQDEHGLKKSQQPLLSFPWLFQKELGKIATGDSRMRSMAEVYAEATPPSLSHDDEAPEASMASPTFSAATYTPKARPASVLIDFDDDDNVEAADVDDVEVQGAVRHRGDLLELFQDLHFTTSGDAQNESVTNEKQRQPRGSGGTTPGTEVVEESVQKERGHVLRQLTISEKHDEAVALERGDRSKENFVMDHDAPGENNNSEEEAIEIDHDSDIPTALERLQRMLE